MPTTCSDYASALNYGKGFHWLVRACGSAAVGGGGARSHDDLYKPTRKNAARTIDPDRKSTAAKITLRMAQEAVRVFVRPGQYGVCTDCM